MTLNEYLQTTTQAAFAEAMGVRQSLVSQWINGHTRITGERAKQIEQVTGELVKRWEVRPDLFDPPQFGRRAEDKVA